MGMSASQARLLSITVRLNHIELESQNISNAKRRLSDNTQAASDEYINALNKTQYTYSTYNSQGDIVAQNLTGASLTSYGELKNQYGLINSSGQILVSELDAKNFQESNTLEEFLDKYGVLSELGKGEMIQVLNPAYAEAEEEYEKLYEEWMAEKPDHENEKYIIPATSSNSIYELFMKTTGLCFDNAAGNNKGDGASIYPNTPTNCFMHVLVAIIGPGTHTTTSGETFQAYHGTNGFNWNSEGWARESVHDQFTEEAKKAFCSGDVIPGGFEYVTTAYGTVPVGGPSSDPNMTVYQRAVDLLWEVHYDYGNNGDYGFGGPATLESLQKFWYFIEHDLKSMSKSEDTFNDELYEEDLAKWKEKEPQKREVSMYVDKEVRKITDNDQAQWYVNLWHRMNGSSDFKGGFGDSEDYNPEDGWASKSKTEQSWAVLKDGDMNSSAYLKYAIDNGLITIEQVQFKEPSEANSGIRSYAWTSVTFAAVTEVSEEKNEIAIALAETKYEQALRDIENKDKAYDNELKQLDTEHNALQTEYDSIKSVIDKNVERTFKVFS